MRIIECIFHLLLIWTQYSLFRPTINWPPSGASWLHNRGWKWWLHVHIKWSAVVDQPMKKSPHIWERYIVHCITASGISIQTKTKQKTKHNKPLGNSLWRTDKCDGCWATDVRRVIQRPHSRWKSYCDKVCRCSSYRFALNGRSRSTTWQSMENAAAPPHRPPWRSD